jgi:hypothetical protein
LNATPQARGLSVITTSLTTLRMGSRSKSDKHKANDPTAMPLDDYVAEVIQVLSDPRPPHGEVLVPRVRALRFAELDGAYEQRFALLNPE